MNKRSFFALALVMAVQVNAATYIWNVSDGYFSNTNHWNPKGLPGTNDTAQIDNPNRTMRIASEQYAKWLYVAAGHVHIEPGANLHVGTSGLWLRGVFGDASVTMSGGLVDINGNFRPDRTFTQTGGQVRATLFSIGSQGHWLMSGNAVYTGTGTGGVNTASAAANTTIELSDQAHFSLLTEFRTASNTLIRLSDQSSVTVSNNNIRNMSASPTTIALHGSDATVTANGFTGGALIWEYHFDRTLPGQAQVVATQDNGTLSLSNRHYIIRLAAGINVSKSTSIPLLRAFGFLGTESDATFDSPFWNMIATGPVFDLTAESEIHFGEYHGLIHPENTPSLDLPAPMPSGWIHIDGVRNHETVALQLQVDPALPDVGDVITAYAALLEDEGYTLQPPEAGFDIALQWQGQHDHPMHFFMFDLANHDDLDPDFAFTRIGITRRPGFTDLNENGMDDDWETLHFGEDPLPEFVMKRGEPVPLLDVFIADLNPHDDSMLEWSSAQADEALPAWSFDTSTNRWYHVFFKTNLMSETDWALLHSNLVGNANGLTIEDPGASDDPMRIYRIGVQLPAP